MGPLALERCRSDEQPPYIGHGAPLTRPAVHDQVAAGGGLLPPKCRSGAKAPAPSSAAAEDDRNPRKREGQGCAWRVGMRDLMPEEAHARHLRRTNSETAMLPGRYGKAPVKIHAMPYRAPTAAQAASGASRECSRCRDADRRARSRGGSLDPRRPASVRLSYVRESGAEQCPDEAVLRDSVSSRLGYDPFDPAAVRTLRVVVRRTRGALVAQIELLDASGPAQSERTPQGEQRHGCVEGSKNAMAIAASLGIDPLAATAAPQARPVPHEEPAAAPPALAAPSSLPPALPPAPPPAAPSEPATPDPRPVRGRRCGRLRRCASTSPAWGATFAAGFRRAWASFDLEGAADWAPTTERNGAGAKSALYMVSVVPCVHLGIGVGCALGGDRRARRDGRPEHASVRPRVLRGRRLAPGSGSPRHGPLFSAGARGWARDAHPRDVHRRQRTDLLGHPAPVGRSRAGRRRRTLMFFSKRMSPPAHPSHPVKPSSVQTAGSIDRPRAVAGSRAPIDLVGLAFRALFDAEFRYVWNTLRYPGVRPPTCRTSGRRSS